MTNTAAMKLKPGTIVETVKGTFKGMVSRVVEARIDGGDIIIETDLDGQMIFFPDELKKLDAKAV